MFYVSEPLKKVVQPPYKVTTTSSLNTQPFPLRREISLDITYVPYSEACGSFLRLDFITPNVQSTRRLAVPPLPPTHRVKHAYQER